MKKMFLAVSVFLVMLLMRPFDAFALEPVLYFSDITSGPKTGLGDGKGSGAIVTVWGVNLGASQGTSQVYVGGVPASYVYYWGNADRTGASGPADLYTYHKMQTISFSVPAGATDGANTISVRVGGVQTNTLPFTVRAGDIYFVKTTGSDTSGTGSWSSPWRSLTYVVTGSGNMGAGGRVGSGDIVYVGSGVSEMSGMAVKYINGTASLPISLIAYPGANVLVQGPSYGIGNWNRGASYWNFSKLVIKTEGDGIQTIFGMRAIANEITNSPGGCADGQGGAISGSKSTVGGGIKGFGNYIHHFGCDSTNKLHHVFYISQRGGTPLESFELGWNYLTDNKAMHALHLYDEGICGDFTGVMKVHDNVVRNQVGVGVDVSTGGTTPACFTMPVWIYNNLFINVGLDSVSYPGHSSVIGLTRENNLSPVKFYNNTFYGFGDLSDSNATFWHGGQYRFGGTFEWVNNIVVNTKGIRYDIGSFKIPNVRGNNLWIDLTGNQSAPSWDTGAITSDPRFVDPSNGYFNLKQDSPARATGANTGSVTTRDLRGIKRGASIPYSIGAFEFISNKMPAAPRLESVE